MKKLLLTSLLALSTTAVFAEELPDVVQTELVMCDTLVSYYTGVPIEIVEDPNKAWLSYDYKLKGKLNISKSYVYSEYGFSHRAGAECEATFRGKETSDKTDYYVRFDKELTDGTRDSIEYYVFIKWTDDDTIETFESKYINGDFSKDFTDNQNLIDHMNEVFTEEGE